MNNLENQVPYLPHYRVIAGKLKARNIKQITLAKRLNRSITAVNYALNGRGCLPLLARIEKYIIAHDRKKQCPKTQQKEQ